MQDRLLHTPVGGDDFASAMRRYVPHGFAFRGFPISFNHISPRRMMDNILASAAAADIVEVSATPNT